MSIAATDRRPMPIRPALCCRMQPSRKERPALDRLAVENRCSTSRGATGQIRRPERRSLSRSTKFSAEKSESDSKKRRSRPSTSLSVFRRNRQALVDPARRGAIEEMSAECRPRLITNGMSEVARALLGANADG